MGGQGQGYFTGDAELMEDIPLYLLCTVRVKSKNPLLCCCFLAALHVMWDLSSLTRG